MIEGVGEKAMAKKQIVYPYIPNSVSGVKTQMLKEIGIDSINDIYAEIPEHLRLHRKLKLPEPMPDEHSIRRHMEGLLRKNKNCSEYLNFLGAGCAQHYVPAVCDEINGRGEFLTAYVGGCYSDHGKWQAWFEFASLIGELLDMDYCGTPVYDGAQAAATALRMASRLTGRTEVLLPKTLNPEILSVAKNYLKGVSSAGIEIRMIEFNRNTGLLDLEDLKSKISPKTAAVLIENPSYLGFIETQTEEIGGVVRENGSEFIVSTDPMCLGVIAPPASYGATIACGDFHSLGMHMLCGGGQAGFIATHGDMEHASQYKDLVVGLVDTVKEGERGFALVLPEKIMYFAREQGNEYTGTSGGLWAITAAVYLSLMGPKGMQEIGQTIMQKAQYAAKRISEIDGVALTFASPFFKEFLVSFDKTDKTVKQINNALLDFKIFGGKDISVEFADLGQSALYCVTEIMTKDDIDTLVGALAKVIK